MRLRQPAYALTLALALLGGTTCNAQDDEPPLAPPEGAAASSGIKATLRDWGVTGSARGAYWSSNRRSDDESHLGVGQLWAKLDRKLGKGMGVFAEGYLGKEDILGDKRSTHRVREAYLDFRHDKWDFRVGKQILAWGRTDRLNPSDNLTPRDFTLLSPEFDEDRFGSLAAKDSFNWGQGQSVTAAWLPDFQSHEYPFTNNPDVTFNHDEPSSARQFGIKYDVSGGNIDWSASYYDGFDLTPDISLARVTAMHTFIDLRHHRVKVLGADAATTRGANRYAVEAAYTRTEDSDGANPSIKNPHFYGVFGLEHDFTNNLSGIVQYFYRHVFHFNPVDAIANPDVRNAAADNAVLNNQYDENQHGLSARIAKKWMNETLEGEFAGSVLLNRAGYFLRTKVSYIWSDSIKLLGGYEYSSGSDNTSYQLLAKNKALFAEIRWFF
ncbi:MAG: hypothetical protein EXR36_06640 [Betaproteobacteria bacterium]|nr:hypothetical protein [Betaproteobacteria bacterium]